MTQHGHRPEHRAKRLLRFAYPVTMTYLIVMVTLTVLLLLSDANLKCGC